MFWRCVTAFRERLRSVLGASESVRQRIGVWEHFGSVWKRLFSRLFAEGTVQFDLIVAVVAQSYRRIRRVGCTAVAVRIENNR